MKLRILTIVGLTLLFSGCTAHMKHGQAFISETRTLGLDISVPVPFAEGVSIANVRVGWVENKIYSGNGVKLTSDSKHKDISLLTGQGTVERIFHVGPEPTE
jgi:hypothetical protein